MSEITYVYAKNKREALEEARLRTGMVAVSAKRAGTKHNYPVYQVKVRIKSRLKKLMLGK